MKYPPVEAAALIDLARARLFLGEDMEGEAGVGRQKLSRPNLGDSGELVIRLFHLLKQVPKVGDDGIIQCRQAWKLDVSSQFSVQLKLFQARNPCLMLRGGKKARETLAALCSLRVPCFFWGAN